MNKNLKEKQKAFPSLPPLPRFKYYRGFAKRRKSAQRRRKKTADRIFSTEFIKTTREEETNNKKATPRAIAKHDACATAPRELKDVRPDNRGQNRRNSLFHRRITCRQEKRGAFQMGTLKSEKCLSSFPGRREEAPRRFAVDAAGRGNFARPHVKRARRENKEEITEEKQKPRH